MGLIRFAVHPASMLDNWPEVHAGYLVGADGRIFPTRIELQDNIIGCRRTSAESAKFHVVWPVEGFGRIVLPTASLPENEKPYLLAVELARGKIVQVRNQAATWELAGLRIPQEFAEPHRKAHRLFFRASSIQSRPEEASKLADEALQYACEASDLLTRSYAAQSLAGRLLRFGSLPLSIGCDLQGQVPPAATQDLFNSMFSAANVSVPWRIIEAIEGEYNWETTDRQLDWCESQKLMVRGGPLLDLGSNCLPTWLSRWENDVLNLQSFVCDFVETAVSRYLGRIRVWEICTRMNTGNALALSEEVRLTLTARVLDVARQVDEESQLIIRIDQPWGDYQSRGQNRLSPLQIVDALVRSGVGLSGVNLELAFGYKQGGSFNRDLLEISRLIDTWTLLDIPIFVTLICPSAATNDPMAVPEIQTNPNVWPSPLDERVQADWLEQMLELLVAKHRVAGVYFPHFAESSPHEFPQAGLVRADDTPKPATERILSQRLGHRRK